jgi:hypothetical protein
MLCSSLGTLPYLKPRISCWRFLPSSCIFVKRNFFFCRIFFSFGHQGRIPYKVLSPGFVSVNLSVTRQLLPSYTGGYLSMSCIPGIPTGCNSDRYTAHGLLCFRSNPRGNAFIGMLTAWLNRCLQTYPFGLESFSRIQASYLAGPLPSCSGTGRTGGFENRVQYPVLQPNMWNLHRVCRLGHWKDPLYMRWIFHLPRGRAKAVQQPTAG